MKLRNVFVVTAVVGSLALAGCSTSETSETSDSEGESQLVVPDVAREGARAEFLQVMAVNTIAQDAHALLVRRCMDKAGFDYQIPVIDPFDVDDAIGVPRVSVEQAKLEGYPPGMWDSHPSRELGLTDEYGEALYGVEDEDVWATGSFAGDEIEGSAGGCKAEADIAVFGSVDTALTVVDVVPDAGYEATYATADDPGNEIIDQEWHECMADSPYPDLTSPGAAVTRAGRDKPEEEISIAVADAQCREETGYQAKLDAIVDRYLTAWLDKNEGAITELQALNAKATESAQKILSGN